MLNTLSLLMQIVCGALNVQRNIYVRRVGSFSIKASGGKLCSPNQRSRSDKDEQDKARIAWEGAQVKDGVGLELRNSPVSATAICRMSSACKQMHRERTAGYKCTFTSFVRRPD